MHCKLRREHHRNSTIITHIFYFTCFKINYRERLRIPNQNFTVTTLNKDVMAVILEIKVKKYFNWTKLKILEFQK